MAHRTSRSRRQNGTVLAVLPDGAGGWYVGGTFTFIGVARSALAHIRADKSVDPNFDPDVEFPGSIPQVSGLALIDLTDDANTTQAVTLPVSGLTPGTTYLDRIVATNANGTTTGAVRNFTTGAGT